MNKLLLKVSCEIDVARGDDDPSHLKFEIDDDGCAWVTAYIGHGREATLHMSSDDVAALSAFLAKKP